jgi:hypothetical protein
MTYIGQEFTSRNGLPTFAGLIAEYEGAVPGDTLREAFNTSVGGNLNTCFSYFGPDVSVINFDHDVLPSVEVARDVLDHLETSMVDLAAGDLRLERGAAAGGIVIPVDFMRASTVPHFLLVGEEIAEEDDQSYMRLRVGGERREPEFVVSHIAGVQDHSAQFLLNQTVEARATLTAATPHRFTPAAPVAPVLAHRSKLITTTLTHRRHGLAPHSLGFAGTEIRVQDFLTGSFQNVLGGRPIYWAPIYLTHNRKYGVRQEGDFGRYLLNEEFMYVFLEAARLLEAGGGCQDFETLAGRWEGSIRQVLTDERLEAMLQTGERWSDRLDDEAIDHSYHTAAASIRAAFGLMLDHGAARGDLRARIEFEARLVARYLRARPVIDALGRQAGARRYEITLGGGAG